MEVAPDGMVWLIHQEGGLVSFDGDSNERYLDDLLVRDLAVDSDGSVWVFGNDGKPKTADIYLVRPADTAGG